MTMKIPTRTSFENIANYRSGITTGGTSSAAKVVEGHESLEQWQRCG